MISNRVSLFRRFYSTCFTLILVTMANPASADTPIIQPGAPGEPAQDLSAADAIEIANTSYSMDDVRFMQDMIPHHHQAMQMAELVNDRTNNPELIDIAGRRLLINSATKYAFAVDAKTGELCWQVSQEDPKNSVCTIPVLAQSELVLTNASRGYGAIFGVRLDGLQAEKTWIKELTISHGSTVCVDGQVYGASGRGVARGWLAVNAETGSLATVAELEGGSLIYADGRFYCLTQRGMMTLQKPTEGKFETVGSFQVAEGKDVWAHPVICNGRLYLRFNETLFCYDIRS